MIANKIRWVLCILLLGGASLQAQNLQGRVADQSSGEKLAGATVIIRELQRGTNTDEQGAFSFTGLAAGEYTLTVSYLGYVSAREEVRVEAGQTASIEINLSPEALVGEEVIISASRRPEKVTQAPATINLVQAQDIAELPSFNVGELAARQKGVDYVRAGVLGTGLNVRGFNSAFNPKNLQVNDMRLSTLIATGLPFGSLGTVVKEDIERVEIILGPAAVLYGPNAHNGLVNTITKDPRDHPGTTIALGGGFDPRSGSDAYVWSTRFRTAHVLSPKLAFKVTGEYTAGMEFPYMDTVYVGAAKYDELELDRSFDNLRGETQFIFTPKRNHDIYVSAGASNSNNLAQTNAGRNQIRDWRIFYTQVRYQSPRFFAQLYHTWSVTDSTYAINQRTQNYYTFLNSGFSDEEARRRSYREAWAPLPGGGGVPLNRGALFIDRSSRLNGEVQYNNQWGGLSLITGVQYQRDVANSEETYLLDGGSEDPIIVNQVGGYAQLEYKVGTRFKALVAARADNHDLYGFNFVPKAALLGFVKNGAVRLTYGEGIAAPTILNLEANIFGGLLLGNGQGFTRSDGSQVDPLVVEKIRTLEVGYKGVVAKRLYVDVNAYVNFSQDFLSPSINIAPRAFTDTILVTHRGDTPIGEIGGGLFAPGDFVLTYVNFGSVMTYGADLGLRLAINKYLDATLNYSWFDFSLDTEDLENDGNLDGKVQETDLPINAPTHKLGAGLTFRQERFFANVFVRWVQAYDFFSGINVASATREGLVVGGSPVVEDSRVGRTWNYGPLGGFVNVDISAGYRFGDNISLSTSVTNLFNAEVREFVASPAIGPMINGELRITFGGKRE
ncbi:MAG: hypothetical protein OHK0039_36530 [Bacteroidia bacterium]